VQENELFTLILEHEETFEPNSHFNNLVKVGVKGGARRALCLVEQTQADNGSGLSGNEERDVRGALGALTAINSTLLTLDDVFMKAVFDTRR